MSVVDKELKKEISAFVQFPYTITLKNGQEITIQQLSWKKELQIIKLLGDFIEEVGNLLDFNEEEFDYIQNNIASSNIHKLLASILKYSPDLLTEIVCIITDKKKEEVENEFVLEDVVEVVFPFLGNIIQRLQEIFQKKIKIVIEQIKKK